MMKKIALPLLACALLAACSRPMRSPSGLLRADVSADTAGLYYTVSCAGRTVIDTSAMGVAVDGVRLFRDAGLRLTRKRTIDESYPLLGRKAVGRAHCNEYVYAVTHRPTGYVYRLEMRLFDDGFAYRFVLPGEGARTVNGEAAEWRPPQTGEVWFAERRSDWKLKTYAGEWVRTRPDSLHTVSPEGPVQTMPLVCRTADDYILITEAALYDYSGMRLRAEADGSLRADFTEEEGFRLQGDIVTPWRLTIVAQSLDALLDTDVITALNPAPDPELFGDGAWIVPGRSLWSWWSGFDGKFMTGDGERQVIDIAAAMGFEYSTLDDGWEERPDKWRFVADLAEYGRERGVGLFVWRHWSKLNDPADDYRQMRGFLDSVAAAGVRGVKVDFMNGEGLRQVEFDTRLLQNAARRRLLVNLHGCHKPTGESRTYPNEITREGVRGIELNRIAAAYVQEMRRKGRPADPHRYVPGGENQPIPASHNAALPFTRGVLGAADYTPVAFTLPGDTTPAHQLAMALMLDSPLLTVAENPAVLAADPRFSAARELLSRLPTVWDETRVLPASRIGRRALIARRKGKVWYVAGVCTDPARVVIPPAYLPADAPLTLIADDPHGGLRSRCIERRDDGSVAVEMGRNGGFVLVAG